MTRDETQKLLAVIGATYPNFKPEDKTATVNAWSIFLEDFDYKQIETALKTYVRNNEGKGFAPSVDQLIHLTRKVEELNQMSEGEAWTRLRLAIGNSGWHAKEEFDKLPRDIQKAIGNSPAILYGWAIDENFNEAVVQSQFLRAFRIVQQRNRDVAYLPQEERARYELLQQASQMRIESQGG